MDGNRTMAGGCFFPIFIVAGFLVGLAANNAVAGAVIGTAAGIVAALIVWLIDRRRRPR